MAPRDRVEEDEEEEDTGTQTRRRQENANSGITIDPGGFLSSLGSILSWGFWGALIGGIVIAAAGPISQILPESWRPGFLNFIDGIKDKIDGMLPEPFFDVPEARLREMATPEHLQEEIVGALQKQGVEAAQAAQLAVDMLPDDAARQEFYRFLDSQNLTLKGLRQDASVLMQPERLTALIEQSPRMVGNVITRQLAAGGAGGAIPDMIKTPLKAAIERGLLSRPEHQAWIGEAFNGLAASLPAAMQPVVPAVQKHPELVKRVFVNALDGKTGADMLGDLTGYPDVQQAVSQATRTTVLNDPTLKPFVDALVAADPSVQTELDALEIKDAASVQAALLNIVMKDAKRVDALKNVSKEHMAPLLDGFAAQLGLVGEDGQINPRLKALRDDLLEDKTRAAILTLMSKLTATNTPGNNEMLAAIAAAATSNGELAALGVLGTYVSGSPARKAALTEFADALEQIGVSRGGESEARYKGNAQKIRELVDKSDQAAELGKASEATPVDVQPILARYIQGGEKELLNVLVDPFARAELNTEVNGRRVLFHLGDALAAMDASKFEGGAKMLTWLTTKQGDAYPNLLLLVNEAERLDNSVGMNVTNEVLLHEKVATAPDTLTADDQADEKYEVESDKEILKLAAVLMRGMQGTLTPVGAANPYPVYNVPVTYLVGKPDDQPAQTELLDVTAATLADENKTDATLFSKDSGLQANLRAQAPMLTMLGNVFKNMDSSAFLAQYPQYADALAKARAGFYNDKEGGQPGVIEEGEGAAYALLDTDTFAQALMKLGATKEDLQEESGIGNFLGGLLMNAEGSLFADHGKLLDIANTFSAAGGGNAQQVAEVQNQRTPGAKDNILLNLFGLGA